MSGRVAPWLLAGAIAGLCLALLDVLALLPVLGAPTPAARLLAICAGALLAPGLLAGALLQRLPASGRAAGLLALLGLLLFYLDTRAYRRLYPGAHALLLLMELVLFTVSARWLLGARAPRRFALLAPLLAMAAGGLAVLVLGRDPEARRLAYQETTAARQVLSLLARLGGPAPQGRRPLAAPTKSAPPQAAVPLTTADPIEGAHLVLVTIDALRADRLTKHRAGRPLTPALAALAAQAVSFDRAYAAAPHTAYSLASLLTGSPVRALSELRAPLPRTLAEHLSERGYRARALLPEGLFFNGRHALARYVGSHFGFGSPRFHSGGAASATAAARAFLEELRDAGEPSAFLWIHYFDPHEPYERRAAHDFGPGAEDRYDGEVAAVDDAIGELRAALAGLLRPVVLVVTADHGEEFNDHGGYYHGSSLYDEQVRVPLLIQAPGLGPRRVQPAVSLTDVAPTVLGLLGQPPLAGAAGRDLGPLLVGAAAEEAPVVAEVDTKRMVVRGGWKLIHDQLRDTWELYDLARDPRERSSEYARQPALAAALTADLYEWLDRVHRQAREPMPIARGRLGDRRVIPELGALLREGPEETRAEAARLLGELEGAAEREALLQALGDRDEAVRTEAALSLGQLFDLRAVPELEAALSRPAYRLRAGIQLGRLRQESAEPALIEALAAPQPLLRRQAAVYLGRVGGLGAVGPLLSRRDDAHAARDVALALGRIGARAGGWAVLGPLLAWLADETRDDVVAELCHGLAALGDRRAVPALLATLRRSPEQSWAAEALVRLGALEGPRAALSGLDLGPGALQHSTGFSGCVQRDRVNADALGGGTCKLDRGPGALRFRVWRPAQSYLLLLRLMPGALDLGETTLALRLNGQALPRQRLQPGWQELAVPVSGALLRHGDNRLDLRLWPTPAGARGLLTVDRLLLVPR